MKIEPFDDPGLEKVEATLEKWREIIRSIPKEDTRLRAYALHKYAMVYAIHSRPRYVVTEGSPDGEIS